MTDPELIERAHAAFVTEWHAADNEGDEGNRSRRGVVAVLSVVAPLIAAQALEDAADEVDSLYFGPDQNTSFTRGSAMLWGAKQAAKRVRERAAKLRGADQ